MSEALQELRKGYVEQDNMVFKALAGEEYIAALEARLAKAGRLQKRGREGEEQLVAADEAPVASGTAKRVVIGHLESSLRAWPEWRNEARNVGELDSIVVDLEKLVSKVRAIGG